MDARGAEDPASFTTPDGALRGTPRRGMAPVFVHTLSAAGASRCSAARSTALRIDVMSALA